MRMKVRNFGRNQQGFTVVELCIAILVMVVAYALYEHAAIPLWNMWKARQEAVAADHFTTLVKQSGMNGGFGTGSLLSAYYKTAPGQWTVSGTQAAPVITNEFGGVVQANGNGATATVILPNEDQKSCETVVTTIAGKYADATITAGSQSYAQGTKVTTFQADQACTADSQTVTYTVNAGM